MKFNIFFPLVLIVTILIFLSLDKIDSKAKQNSNRDSSISISITAVGDLMCHLIEADYAKTASDSFNFNPYYDSVRSYIESSDFAFANLETVTAGKSAGYSGYPMFNSPDQFISAIKNAGFKLISTANNHALDRGEFGVLRTIKQLRDNNLNYNGTFTSQRDRDSIRIFDIKGIKVAFLAYTFGTNGNKVPKSYLINIIDTSLIHKDIKAARNKGAEIVLVHFHFGKEYQRYPNDYQKNIVNAAISFGADLIIGGHPHVIEPVYYFKTFDPNLDSGFAAYSLGNFLSNQRWRYSDAGVILTIKIEKKIPENKFYISSVEYTPTWVFKGKIGNKNSFEILPAKFAFDKKYPDYLSSKDLAKMRQAFGDTQFILTRYTNRLTAF